MNLAIGAVSFGPLLVILAAGWLLTGALIDAPDRKPGPGDRAREALRRARKWLGNAGRLARELPRAVTPKRGRHHAPRGGFADSLFVLLNDWIAMDIALAGAR